ncbi:hypothetical protein VTN02DRAFT_4262 [Thermoascus thermophilus]
MMALDLDAMDETEYVSARHDNSDADLCHMDELQEEYPCGPWPLLCGDCSAAKNTPHDCLSAVVPFSQIYRQLDSFVLRYIGICQPHIIPPRGTEGHMISLTCMRHPANTILESFVLQDPPNHHYQIVSRIFPPSAMTSANRICYLPSIINSVT